MNEHATKQIVCYLNAAAEKRFIMKTDYRFLKINSFLDSNFPWIYSDPVCAKSRTGHVIMVANSSIMWQSKLQSVTAQHIVEAKIMAPAHSCHGMFPIMDGVNVMGKAIGLLIGRPPFVFQSMKISLDLLF